MSTPSSLLNQRVLHKNNKRPKKKNTRSGGQKIRQVRYPSTWEIDRLVPFPAPGIFDNQVYNVVDANYQTLITTGTVTNTFAAFTAYLSNMPDYANYTQTFDQYRIMACECIITPNGPLNPSSGPYTGQLYSVIDYDDATSITPGAALNYSNCIMTNIGDTLVRTFKPHIALAAYSGTFASYANTSDQWLDTGSAGVAHYGLKVAATPTLVAVTYNLIIRYWMQFRNPR